VDRACVTSAREIVAARKAHPRLGRIGDGAMQLSQIGHCTNDLEVKKENGLVAIIGSGRQ